MVNTIHTQILGLAENDPPWGNERKDFTSIQREENLRTYKVQKYEIA